MSKELLSLTKEPDEGAPYSKNLSAYKGVFLGGETLTSFDGLKNPVNWVYEYNNVEGSLHVQREDGKSERVEVFTGRKALDSISVVFDRQMQIVVTYYKGEKCFIWYWDALEDKYIEYELDGQYIKATLSSHYTLHAPFSEVVVGYVADNTRLCIRLQRDRYRREYEVHKFDNKIKLFSISYTDKNRFQYEVLEAL